LLARLLQEDFIILEWDETGQVWRFACGTAVFSFVELGINGERGFMRPGAALAEIHSPVPGFQPTLYTQVGRSNPCLPTEDGRLVATCPECGLRGGPTGGQTGW